MLNHPTLDKLQAMRLTGMLKALIEQAAIPDIEALSFEERLGLLIDREMTEREDRRLKTRLRQAKLKQNACVEEIDYRHPRGLDKSLMRDLIQCQWIKRHLNLLITGPTGVGKTWIGCALAQKACREGYTACTCVCRDSFRNSPLRKVMAPMPSCWSAWRRSMC